MAAGAKNTEGLGGGQTSAAAAKGADSSGATSNAPNSAGAEQLNNGKPYGGDSDRPFGQGGIVSEMLGGGVGSASTANQNPTTSLENERSK